jgi:hypothetical protein
MRKVMKKRRSMIMYEKDYKEYCEFKKIIKRRFGRCTRKV